MENKVTADYLDEEGCLHCGTCGKRKQMKVSLMGFEHVVSCLCECEVKARQELDEKMQREEAQRLLYQRKSVGLRERRFWEWTNALFHCPVCPFFKMLRSNFISVYKMVCFLIIGMKVQL